MPTNALQHCLRPSKGISTCHPRRQGLATITGNFDLPRMARTSTARSALPEHFNFKDAKQRLCLKEH